MRGFACKTSPRLRAFIGGVALASCLVAAAATSWHAHGAISCDDGYVAGAARATHDDGCVVCHLSKLSVPPPAAAHAPRADAAIVPHEGDEMGLPDFPFDAAARDARAPPS